eukprot:CAMPEP_0115743852 /NCGR_PEP_ID=MMETSP0272-20121206/91291_1 /TAXON_ID=71861 /ORGANISM="Scrippsiella trochoidea, Strain CCMP3099" /LENGTH=117 /DNA_ID=CAMNT_0003188687 /DNA_START=178 /DNA_END=531 /DNA_ORIENTATION=+
MNSPRGACCSVPAAATSATSKADTKGAGRIEPNAPAMPQRMYVRLRRSASSSGDAKLGNIFIINFAKIWPRAAPVAPKPASKPKVAPPQSDAMQQTSTLADVKGSTFWCFNSVMKDG